MIMRGWEVSEHRIFRFEIISTEHVSIFELAAGSHADERKSATRRVVKDARGYKIMALYYCPLHWVCWLRLKMRPVITIWVVMRY